MCFNHVLKVNIGLCFSIYSTDCWFRCNNSSVLSWDRSCKYTSGLLHSARSSFVHLYYVSPFATSISSLLPRLFSFCLPLLSLCLPISPNSLSLCPPLSPLHNFEFPINRSGLPQNEQMQSCQSVNSKFLSYLNLCPSQSYKPCPNTNAKWKSAEKARQFTLRNQAAENKTCGQQITRWGPQIRKI